MPTRFSPVLPLTGRGRWDGATDSNCTSSATTGEIDNSDIINYDQLYSQLYTELQQGRRYWFEDEENARIMRQNEDFQQVYDYEKMIELTYLSPEETASDAKPILVKDIMKRLARKFPTFNIRKSTDMELGHRLSAMGYTYHKLTQGAAYRIIEI
jgi:hypothetical protein